MAFNVNALGFGDNVVDRYEHIHTMYPVSYTHLTLPTILRV